LVHVHQARSYRVHHIVGGIDSLLRLLNAVLYVCWRHVSHNICHWRVDNVVDCVGDLFDLAYDLLEGLARSSVDLILQILLVLIVHLLA